MLITWPPAVGVASLILAEPLGMLVFGRGHPSGDVIGPVLALITAPILGATSLMAAQGESEQARVAMGRSVRRMKLIYLTDALLVLAPVLAMAASRLLE